MTTSPGSNDPQNTDVDDRTLRLNRTLVGNFDAQIWAREFVELVEEKPSIATDEGTMIGWFANAIMAGFDECQRRVTVTEINRRLAEKAAGR